MKGSFCITEERISCLDKAGERARVLNPDLHILKKLGRKSFLVRNRRKLCVLKISASSEENILLAHEFYYLSNLPFSFLPRPISFCRDEKGAILLRPFLAGQTLSENPGQAKEIATLLEKLHKAGFVHCDLRPENILFSEEKPFIIDWEFAMPLGTEVKNMLLRPYSSGWTHPDLIWKRGKICESFDFWALERMIQNGF